MRNTVYSLPAASSIYTPEQISDADMAWLLAIAADRCLKGHERTMTFVELGSGEYQRAIERIMVAVGTFRMALPTAVFDKLGNWLDGYVGSFDEPRLRTLLAEVRTLQYQLVLLDSHTTGVELGVSVA